MNAKQWDAERSDPQYMAIMLKKIGLPRTKAGRRKLRLFACGCCRLAWHLLQHESLRSAVDVAERFADDQASKAELAVAARRVDEEWFADRTPDVNNIAEWGAASYAAESCLPGAYDAAFGMTALDPQPLGTAAVANSLQSNLLRCVFGNPFLKPAFNKQWRTETVKALAAGIYEGRAFDRLPILADALEEAGCDDPAMLTHLRGPGPHCRGCWVLDLTLGK